MSKKINVSLIPRYEGTSAIEYEKIGSTIRKTRLYKFIRVAYSQPLSPMAGGINPSAGGRNPPKKSIVLETVVETLQLFNYLRHFSSLEYRKTKSATSHALCTPVLTA